MVAFCEHCGISLPKADVIIKEGKEYAVPGYICPNCGQMATVSLKSSAQEVKSEIIPEESESIVIKDGKIERKKLH